MSQLGLPINVQDVRARVREPIVREAEFDALGGYRWTMKRAWGSGPCIHWNLLNPSDADAKRDDPTTIRMMTFSFGWGFGSMIVTNVYPFISSTEDKLRAWRKTFDWKTYESNGMRPWGMDDSSWSAFHHNIGIIGDSSAACAISVAAWGNGVDSDDLEQVLEGARIPIDDCEFTGVGAAIEWKCLGVTKNGSPTHPLARGRHRIPDETKLRPWRRNT